MMDKAEKAAFLKDLLESAGIETRSYSGRGMYGETCLAAVTDRGIADVIIDAIEDALSRHESAVSDALAALRGSRTDSMGRGTVIYWPNLPWTGGDSDE